MKNKRGKKSIKMEKRMNKKAISKILTIIFLILLVLVLIAGLWSLLKNLIKEQGEIAEAKTELMDMDVDIDNVNIPESASTVNITISRGTGRMILKNITIIEPKADIVFLIDTTGSMREEIKDVTATIQEFTEILEERAGGEDPIDYRLALVEFKDYPKYTCGLSNDFPSKIYEFNTGYFTTNAEEYREMVGGMKASGGYDSPESHLTAIKNAIDNLQFRADESGFKKFFIL